MKMARSFTFSVIIPIYNVEDYLREALDSVINQTLDFKEHIQLILINDGSVDKSEEICLEYKERFPENINYIYKENGGVSTARNLGLEQVNSKYVTFLDPDDKWEEHSFENALAFFEKHFDEIDVISARIQFFEAKTNFHSLDYKFKKGTRVADLRSEDELFSVESTVATTFIKASSVGDLRFDSRLKYGEDSTFINKIMLKKCKYGILKEALYLYRRRASGDSAVNLQLTDKSFYINSLLYYHLELFRYSRELYGEVIPYVQSMVAYDVMWRFANPLVKDVLSDGEIAEYEKRIHDIVSEIDDNILLNHAKHKSMPKRRDAIKYKYGVDLYSEVYIGKGENDGWLCFRDVRFFNLKNNKSRCVQVVGVDVENQIFTPQILVANWLFEITKGGCELEFSFNGKAVTPKRENYGLVMQTTSEGEEYYQSLCSCEYNLAENLKRGETLTLTPYLKPKSSGSCRLSLGFGKYVPAATRFGASYKLYGDYGIKCFRDGIKVFFPEDMKKTLRKWDLRAAATLIKRKRPDVIKKRFVDFPRFKKREERKGRIWLISDRIDNAGDNGEVLFRYICEHKPEGVRPIFVIGSDAKEEVKARLRATGEVILAEDKSFLLYFLLAEKIISSSGAEFTINPFGKDREYYRNLLNFKYYYLQHGVTCADLSAWLNRYNKNIYRFFVSGERERNAILEANYYYKPEQLILTGQSRFDALYTDTKKQLLILPTWRRSISQSYDEKTRSVYYDGFKYTEYFKFYNSLINDERLLSVMRKKGYKGLFCLHPIHLEQYVDFEANDVFSVNEGFIDYNKVFAESAVMVTDYSSVLFDFAYLRKPVVYAQFDKEAFFAGQIYDEGYFSYEDDGFGKVCYDLEATVDELISLIENDCKNSEKYLDRVNSFFAFNDKDNSKRILEAILKD